MNENEFVTVNNTHLQMLSSARRVKIENVYE